ncbi:MAG: TIGR03032 family protein [Synechococcaceae cyanobacterium]
MSTSAPLVVSASRADATGFGHTLLGRSLALPVHRPWQPRLALANGRPLAEHYNRALDGADPEALILFCHDDVWLGEQPLLPLLGEALERFDLVGVAGNRRRRPGQVCWWLRPGDGAWDHPHLVGGIRHGDDRRSSASRYGPSPAPAALLDGVALAARAGVLQAAGVRFDPDLDFHFYDLDLCRSAVAAGLRPGVWPLPLIHASGGAAGSSSWQRCREHYQRKWQETPPAPPPAAAARPAAPPAARTATPPSFEITTSRQLLAWLAEQKLSLAFTTYQIGKLFALGLKANGELAVFERTFNRCMGLCPSADGNGFWMSSLYQVWRFENMLGPGEEANGHDRLYVPQLGITTGDCDIHDMAVDGDGRLVMVNTLFSCLATPSDSHSFRPLWRPPFISRLAAEDRCHLNGLAMRDGRPAYATAVAASDAADGWREHRSGGGVLIDVQANAIVATGLSMPHSPRWYRDRLWLCNSGTGDFGTVDLASGRFEPLTFCAGYLRGGTFHGDYALLGTSKARHNKTFSGLPLDDALTRRNVEARCGLQVVDLRTGDAVHWIRFEGLVEELYDVITLPGVRNPALIGFVSDEIRRLISMEQ